MGEIGESLAFEKLITILRKSVDSTLIPIDGKERKGKADLKSMADTVSEKLRKGVKATKRLQDAIQNTHFDGNVMSEACCEFDESNLEYHEDFGRKVNDFALSAASRYVINIQNKTT